LKENVRVGDTIADQKSFELKIKAVADIKIDNCKTNIIVKNHYKVLQ